MQQRLLYPVKEVRQILGGLSQRRFYELVHSGDIALKKVGRRSFVTADELQRFVGSLRDASFGAVA